MKNVKEDFDLMVKNSLDGMEIPPPADLKKGVFNILGRYALMQNIKRNGIYLLLIILFSALGIFAYKTINNPAAKLAEDNKLKSVAFNSNASNAMDNSQSNTYENQNIPESNNPVNKNANLNNDNTPAIIKSAEKITDNNKKQKTVFAVDPQKSLAGKKNQTISATNEKTFTASNYQTQSLTNEQTYAETKVQTVNSAGSANINFSGTYENKSVIFTSPKIKTQNLIPASADLLILNTTEQTKKFNNPLLWSIGINAGHSLYQNQMIKLPSSFDDNNYSFNTSMDFPSVIIGLDARAEKKHFFFDFGVQFAHFSEIVRSGDVMLNPHEEQFVNLAGQTLHIDTAGGYYHYYYLCDSIVRVQDSVWTWKIDSSLVNNYDTINKKVYDTLKNPEWRNSYTFIEIPFFFGWQYNFGKVNIGLKTGPLLSMLIGTKGYIPSNISENATMNETGAEFKKFRLGLSWQVSAVASYFISERMLIECQPYYRFAISGIKSPTGYTLKNNSLGLTVGIRYYF